MRQGAIPGEHDGQYDTHFELDNFLVRCVVVVKDGYGVVAAFSRYDAAGQH